MAVVDEDGLGGLSTAAVSVVGGAWLVLAAKRVGPSGGGAWVSGDGCLSLVAMHIGPPGGAHDAAVSLVGVCGL